jgi:tRNA-binding protein
VLEEIVVGGIYKHYKGKLYRVKGLCRHSESLEELVHYECLYKNDLSSYWVRPKKHFLEEVSFDGKQEPRFLLVDSTLSIDWSDFEKVDLRVGTIIEVSDFPEAKKPAYKLKIDFGPELGVKKSSAQITTYYSKENLLDKQVLAILNFAPRQIGPFMSEVLTTGFVLEDQSVVLLCPTQKIPNGLRLR